MRNTTIKDDIIAKVADLPPNLQLRGLEYANSLSPKGSNGVTLLNFEGAIPAEDLRQMEKAIEDGCEKVSKNSELI
jgi:hypothetical protein